MSEEVFNIKFSEDGAENVIQKMRGMEVAGKAATESTENLNDALGRVRNKANPAQAAYENLARGIGVLDKAQKANLITSGESARLQTNLIAQSSAALRPFSTMIGSIQAETKAWGENSTARAVAQRVMAQTQTLQRAGVVLNAEERESLIATNLAAVQAREAARTTAAAARQAAAEQARASAAAERAAAQEATAQERRSVAISSLLGKIAAETEAVGLNTVERQANLRTIQQAESLRTVGIALNGEETASLLAQNTAYAEQRAAVATLAEAERQLAGVRRTISGAAPDGGVGAKVAAERAAIARAGQLGIVNPAEQAALERQLGAAYASQLDPLSKASSLIRQRAEYQRGLFESGRALAQVEREINSALASGATVETAKIAALRNEAREVDRLDRAYKLLSEAKGFANNVIGGFGLLLGAGAAVRGLDEGTNIRNQISVTSKGADNGDAVTKEVYKTSLDTHTAVEDTAKAYSRINLAVQRYGYSQERVLGITKTLNEAIRLSGAAEGEATRASLDFVHAISSGNVQFRELRALATQAHFVVKDIAEGLTKLATSGTPEGIKLLARAKAAGVNPEANGGIGVGQLKELTSKHAIGSQDVFTAFELQADVTQKKFDALTPTIRQSLTDLNTQFVKFLDNLNQGTGVAGNVARSIEFIGKNLDKLIATGLIFAGILTGLFVKEKLEEFGAAVGVVGQKIGLIKTVTTENSLATDANSAALNTNTGAQAGNKVEIDAVTAALTRQIIARREASVAAVTPITPAGAQAARAEAVAGNAGVVPVFGQRGAPGAAVAGVGAAAAGELATVEAGAARASAGIGGAARAAVASVGAVAGEAVGFVGSLLGGLTAALPLVFALGAAWLLLKDSIVLAKEQTLAFSQDGNAAAIQGTITLGDVAGGVFDLISGKAVDSAETQKAASKDAAATDAAAKQAQLDKAKSTFAQTGNYYDQLHDGLVKQTVDFITHFVVGATYIGQTFQIAMVGIYAAAEKIVQQVTNLVIDFYNNAVVPVLNAAKSIGVGGGAQRQNHVEIKDGSEAYNRLIANRTATTNSLLTNLPNALAKAVIGNSVRRQTSRGAVDTAGGEGTDDDLGGKKKKGRTKKDPLPNEFEELVKKTFPAVEAVKAFTKQMDILQKGIDKGLLTQYVNEANKLDKAHPEYGLGQLTDKQAEARIRATAQRELGDKIDPTRAFVREQGNLQDNLRAGNGDPYQRSIANKISAEEEKEAKALALTTDELKALYPQRIKDIEAVVRQTSAVEQQVKVQDALRAQAQDQAREKGLFGASPELVQAASQAYAIYKDQLLAGVPGAQAAYDAQVKSNLQFIAQKENIDKTKTAYDAIVGPAKAYQDTVVNLNNLLDSGSISLAKYNELLRDGTVKALGDAKDGFSGFERGLLQIKKETEDTATDMQSTFTDAYHNIESGFQGIFTGGSIKDSAHKLFEGLTNDLSKALFHKLTDPLISGIGGKLGVPGFGDKKLDAQRADITATNVYVNGADASSLGNLGLGTNPLANPNTFLGGNYGGLTNPIAANDNGLGGLFRSGQSFLGGGSIFSGGASSSGVDGGLDAALRDIGIGGTSAATGGNLLGAAGGGLGGLGGGIGGLLGGAGSLLGGAGKAAAGGASSALGGIGSLLGPLASFLPPPFNLLGGLLGGLGGGGGGGLGGLLGLLPHFATGGEGVVTGSGGTDSKLVSMMATPGETLQVKTPAQQREGQSGGDAPVVNQKIVNVTNPQDYLDAMSTQAGYKVLLNHIQSNPEAIKRALGS